MHGIVGMAAEGTPDAGLLYSGKQSFLRRLAPLIFRCRTDRLRCM